MDWTDFKEIEYFKKVPLELPIDDLRDSLKSLLMKSNGWIQPFNQIGLMKESHSAKDSFDLGIGYLSDDQSDLNFSYLISSVQDTIMEEIHKKIINSVRSRVVNLSSRKCTSLHRDALMRLHIPIFSENALFHFKDGPTYHFPADGSAYIVNTKKVHCAINPSSQDRIHFLTSLTENTVIRI